MLLSRKYDINALHIIFSTFVSHCSQIYCKFVVVRVALVELQLNALSMTVLKSLSLI